MKNIIIALTSFVLVISCASNWKGSYLTDEEIIEKYVEKEYKTLAYECWLRSSIGGSDQVIRMPKGTKLEILDKGRQTVSELIDKII